jgi:short-subunit dehydrogenase
MKNVALITGSTCGLGLSLAFEFAKQGHDLVLVSHNQKRLDDVVEEIKGKYHVEVFPIMLDLRNDDAAETIYGLCNEKGIQVQYLVNNASVGTYGDFDEVPVDDHELIVQLDVSSLVDLTYLFLHNMIVAKKGYVLNVASTAAFQPGPKMAVYYACKSFVLSFSQAIGEELKGKGVRVMCLCPGPIEAPFTINSGMASSGITKAYKPENPEKVASIAYKELFGKKSVVITRAKNRHRYFWSHFLPRQFVLRRMAKITKPIKGED